MQKKVDYETACIWVKEAEFQNGRTAEFLQYCVEMDGFGAREAVIRKQTKVKRLLVKDREESGLARFSDETLFQS